MAKIIRTIPRYFIAHDKYHSPLFHSSHTRINPDTVYIHRADSNQKKPDAIRRTLNTSERSGFAISSLTFVLISLLSLQKSETERKTIQMERQKQRREWKRYRKRRESRGVRKREKRKKKIKKKKKKEATQQRRTVKTREFNWQAGKVNFLEHPIEKSLLRGHRCIHSVHDSN